MKITAALLAICPSLLMLFYVRKRGKGTDKPLYLFFLIALIGALMGPAAYVFETVFDYALVSILASYKVYSFLASFIEAAFIEELLKLIALNYVSYRFGKYYKTLFDGIIFSVCVALGFAVLENLLYVFIYSSNSVETALLRAITPGHFCFSIFMGLFYSEAKKYQHNYPGIFYRYVSLSLLVPVLIHGLYDYCLIEGGQILTVLFFVLLVFLYAFSFVTIKKRSKTLQFI